MIHVFKTSVETDKDIDKLRHKFAQLSTNLKWNFDLEDCDNILRIDSVEISPKMIIKLLKTANFECQELE